MYDRLLYLPLNDSLRNEAVICGMYSAVKVPLKIIGACKFFTEIVLTFSIDIAFPSTGEVSYVGHYNFMAI